MRWPFVIPSFSMRTQLRTTSISFIFIVTERHTSLMIFFLTSGLTEVAHCHGLIFNKGRIEVIMCDFIYHRHRTTRFVNCCYFPQDVSCYMNSIFLYLRLELRLEVLVIYKKKYWNWKMNFGYFETVHRQVQKLWLLFILHRWVFKTWLHWN